MNIEGPQLFTNFFNTLDESSYYWRTICGLELCFVIFVFNNQCFDLMYCVRITTKKMRKICLYVLLKFLSFWGTSSPRPSTRAPALDPAGGFPWHYITCITN